jgi:hypothetical protein
VVTSPEVLFAARAAPEPARPVPATRRAVFYDVENTSRHEDVARMLDHLAFDRVRQATDLVAVGNWRVIGHETARLLARRGASLVHSAPSPGVRDWTDLRIAIAAGVWLASARPGDTLEIVSDDHAFDAVGDAAASLGVTFRRLSGRIRAGGGVPEESGGPVGRGHRRRRSGRGRRGRSPAGHDGRPSGAHRRAGPQHIARPTPAPAEPSPHTAPRDEIVAMVEELLATSPGGVTIDALTNALKARGFRRPPGSPRLITRLRRIKKLEVTRDGVVRLIDPLPRNGDERESP